MIRSLLNETNAPPIVVTNTPMMETILRRLGLWERSRLKLRWAVRTSVGHLREQQRREFHPRFKPDPVSPRLCWPQERKRQADTQIEPAKIEGPGPAVSRKRPAVHLFRCGDLFCTFCLRVYRCYDSFRPRTNQKRYEVKTPFQGPLTSSKDVGVA